MALLRLLILAVILAAASPGFAASDVDEGATIPSLSALAADTGGTVLAIGDSLTAGFNVRPSDNYPALLGARIAARVVNAGINGDTSAGLLARLPAALSRHHPTLVVLCIGGNDLLRGLSTDLLHANLGRAIGLSRAAGAQVLLLAVPVPFTAHDHPVYREVAQAEGVSLLSGAAGRLGPADFQRDGIQPNAAGYRVIVDALMRVLG